MNYQKSTNRRHDKWADAGARENFDICRTVAICSMWNAGYTPETIAARLQLTLDMVQRTIRACYPYLRKR